MLGLVEAQLPEHQERQFPPTVTLAMFMGQIMSADGSCQNAVNEAIVARLLAWMNPGSVSTIGYCQARQRLPQEMVGMLARQSGALLGEHPPPRVAVARPTREACGWYDGVRDEYAPIPNSSDT